MRRDRSSKAFYNSAAWRRLRTLTLAGSPVCQRCKRSLATDVHHDQAVREAPDRKLDPTNLIALCGACHKRVEAERKGSKA